MVKKLYEKWKISIDFFLPKWYYFIRGVRRTLKASEAKDSFSNAHAEVSELADEQD